MGSELRLQDAVKRRPTISSARAARFPISRQELREHCPVEQVAEHFLGQCRRHLGPHTPLFNQLLKPGPPFISVSFLIHEIKGLPILGNSARS